MTKQDDVETVYQSEEEPVRKGKEWCKEVIEKNKKYGPRKTFEISKAEYKHKLKNSNLLSQYKQLIQKEREKNFNPKEKLLWRRGWHSIEEGERVLGKDEIEKRIIKSEIKSENKIEIIKNFIEEKTGKKIPNWCDALEFIVNNGTTLTSIILHFPFNELKVMIANKILDTERVSQQKMTLRKYPNYTDENDEVIIITHIMNLREKVFLTIFKNNDIIIKEDPYFTFNIVEINVLKYDYTEPKEAERKFNIKSKILEKVIKEIDEQKADNSKLKELYYEAKVLEQISKRKNEVIEELGDEDLYCSYQIGKRELLKKYEIEYLNKATKIAAMNILPI